MSPTASPTMTGESLFITAMASDHLSRTTEAAMDYGANFSADSVYELIVSTM